MTHRDPTRWLDATEVDGDFKAALGAAVDPGPSAAQLRRMAERLGVKLAEHVPAPGSQPAAPSPWPRASGVLGRLALLCAPLLAGVIWWAVADSPPEAPPRAAEAASVEAPRGAAPAAPAPPPHELQGTAPAEAPPQRTAPARALRRRAAAAAAAPGPVASDPLAELALLRKARAALRSDPEGALQLTERHRREHGRGMLAEERELLATEALMNLGRTDEARARAGAFERAYPSSAHTRRLHVILSGVKP